MSAKMNLSKDGTITITPEKPTAAVVFLHGLGDSGHGWTDTMASLSQQLPYIKFILPSVALALLHIVQFDIPMTKRETAENEGIDESRALVTRLIENEVSGGIPHSRIVLGGFSQGGALSYFTGYQMKKAIAGVLALSCAIPKMHAFAVTPEAKSVPALVCHGDADPMLIFSRAQVSVEKLQDSGVDLDFRVYSGMRHTVNMQELADIREWLQKVLPESSS